jgi:anti-sigma regulatory factor (Ser/Thr protein kinase)
MSPATVTLTFGPDLGELNRIADELGRFGSAHGLGEETIAAVHLAVEEIVTNAIKHGCGDEQDHQLSVRLTCDGRELTAVIEDDACAYNPLERVDPDVNLPIEERPIGGLGIFLVRRLMDHVDYQRVDGRNVFTMKKRCGAEAAGEPGA